MAKTTKKRKDALAKFDKSAPYAISDAVNIIKNITYTKFDAAVDLDIRLGVDPRKANQIAIAASAIRGWRRPRTASGIARTL